MSQDGTDRVLGRLVEAMTLFEMDGTRRRTDAKGNRVGLTENLEFVCNNRKQDAKKYTTRARDLGRSLHVLCQTAIKDAIDRLQYQVGEMESLETAIMEKCGLHVQLCNACDMVESAHYVDCSGDQWQCHGLRVRVGRTPSRMSSFRRLGDHDVSFPDDIDHHDIVDYYHRHHQDGGQRQDHWQRQQQLVHGPGKQLRVSQLEVTCTGQCHLPAPGYGNLEPTTVTQSGITINPDCENPTKFKYGYYDEHRYPTGPLFYQPSSCEAIPHDIDHRGDRLTHSNGIASCESDEHRFAYQAMTLSDLASAALNVSNMHTCASSTTSSQTAASAASGDVSMYYAGALPAIVHPTVPSSTYPIRFGEAVHTHADMRSSMVAATAHANGYSATRKLMAISDPLGIANGYVFHDHNGAPRISSSYESDQHRHHVTDHAIPDCSTAGHVHDHASSYSQWVEVQRPPSSQVVLAAASAAQCQAQPAVVLVADSRIRIPNRILGTETPDMIAIDSDNHDDPSSHSNFGIGSTNGTAPKLSTSSSTSMPVPVPVLTNYTTFNNSSGVQRASLPSTAAAAVVRNGSSAEMQGRLRIPPMIDIVNYLYANGLLARSSISAHDHAASAVSNATVMSASDSRFGNGGQSVYSANCNGYPATGYGFQSMQPESTASSPVTGVSVSGFPIPEPITTSISGFPYYPTEVSDEFGQTSLQQCHPDHDPASIAMGFRNPMPAAPADIDRSINGMILDTVVTSQSTPDPQSGRVDILDTVPLVSTNTSTPQLSHFTPGLLDTAAMLTSTPRTDILDTLVTSTPASHVLDTISAYRSL